jgi:glycosyltransferase involved in cell wall biosynthesis
VPDALGFVPHGELARLYERAAVVVFPSRQEGLPLSLLEAMAHGCPVVATRVGGIPQLVHDGDTGLLVPPGEPAALRSAIETVLADPALGRRLGRAARRRVGALCSWDRVTELTLEAYAGAGPSLERPQLRRGAAPAEPQALPGTTVAAAESAP